MTDLFPCFTNVLTASVCKSNQSRFWYFKSLYNKDAVSNRAYQNFRDKRLVRPGSKCPNWQRPQPITYKTKFSQRYNIYLLDLKYNITYQNIRGKLRSNQFLYHEMPKMTKSYLATYMDELATKLRSLF